MKSKLHYKASSHITEEGVLLKAFKYYDLSNSGTCNETNFIKTIRKIGIVSYTDKELLSFYSAYTQTLPNLNYKEFITNLFDSSSSFPTTIPSKLTENTLNKGENALLKVKQKLISRGIRGLLQIATNFVDVDENNTNSIYLDEFINVLKNSRLGLIEGEMIQIFKLFEKDKSNTIEYHEFIIAIRGEMSEQRKHIVEEIYKHIQHSLQNDNITINNLINVFNSEKHPDVISLKKNEDEIIQELIDTLHMNRYYIYGTSYNEDNGVTIEEFIEYYEYISMLINDDNYFNNIIRDVWCNNQNTEKQLHNNKQQQSKNAFNILKENLISQGLDGIFNLYKQFKLYDHDNIKQLLYGDFCNALTNCNINMNNSLMMEIFKMFDINNSNYINYIEIIKAIKGDIPKQRLTIILKAFEKLDYYNSGITTLSEIKSMFNTKNHPDVLYNNKTEEEIYKEFIETFEQHHNLLKGYRDKRVSKDEFIDYYSFVSLCIDDDSYFEAILSSTWKLSSKLQYVPSTYSHNEDTQSIASTIKQKQHQYITNKQGIIKAQAPFGTYDDEEPQLNPNDFKSQTFNTKYTSDVLNDFRKLIQARGSRGLMSIKRSFLIIDESNTGKISFNDFKKYLSDYRYNITQSQAESIFNLFECDNEGKIYYKDLLQVIETELNEFRLQLIENAYKKILKFKNDLINIRDIRIYYKAEKHPDVINKHKTYDKILAEFVDILNYHFYLLNTSPNENEDISLDEFIDFYKNISFSITNDETFKSIITNVW